VPVVDASVWVSLCHSGDRYHGKSRRWLENALGKAEQLAAPTLLRVEVAAAIRRLTGDQRLAEEALATLEGHGWVELVDLDSERSRRAAEIASATGARGADAVYLELAVQRRVTLVTWGRQQRARGSAVARVETP
jgi:predicted nucleic acid-binding protein